MSTRCNIIIKDQYDQLIYYRHSDGYPSVTLNSLNIFMQWIKENKIRNNTGQGAGWIIALGMKEYDTKYDFKTHKDIKKKDLLTPDKNDQSMGWKIGAYEPSTSIHGDIEYLYTLTIDKNPEMLVESVNHTYNKDYTKSTIHKKKLGIITDFYKVYDDNLNEVK